MQLKLVAIFAQTEMKKLSYCDIIKTYYFLKDKNDSMRHYECKCLNCGSKKQVAFSEEPYPEFGDTFTLLCRNCGLEASHTIVLTKRIASALRMKQAENDLQKSISDKCDKYGFQCRFLYQSVVITTPLSDWCFDYHQHRITLYHESTRKINFETGNYAKSHIQFKDRKILPLEVIDYIASHENYRLNEKTKIT